MRVARHHGLKAARRSHFGANKVQPIGRDDFVQDVVIRSLVAFAVLGLR